MGFAFFEERMKVGHVIREGEDEGEGDSSPLVELNSNLRVCSGFRRS
jgi:hypothetical protein